MSGNKETVQERLERMKKQKEASGGTELVSQLTHETTGEPDFKELAQRLSARNQKERVLKRDTTEKITFYIDQDVIAAFYALCTEHGDKTRYINQALRDFIKKKARELDV